MAGFGNSGGDSALTELMCQNWDTSGRNEFVGLCKAVFSMDQDETLFECGSNHDVKRMLYELCWSVLRSNLKCEQVVGVLPDLIAAQVETAPMLMDVFAIIDLEMQVSTEEDVKEKFIQLRSACLPTVVPKDVSEEMLDLDRSSGIQVLKHFPQFPKTETNASDRQQKRSVLCEENEGYAKLICELNQPFDPTVDVVYRIDVIKSLFGCFNLDPNRVLRIILESFEIRTSESNFFIPLLRAYMCDEDTFCKMLGAKFKLSQDFESTESLYTIAGLLIGYEVVSSSGIYHYLTPDDNEIIDDSKKLLDGAKAYARSMCLVSTADTNVVSEDMDTTVDQYQLNQKLGLCETLLKLSDWKHAKQVIDLLPCYYATSWFPIASRICKMIHITIDPLYRRYVIDGPSRYCAEEMNMEFAPKPLECFADFQDSVLPMICSLGLYLHQDPILMVKIARVAKAYLILHPNEVFGLEFDIFTILDEALIPSLSLLECNCCMAEELWNLIQLYPYQYRYRLYGLWKNKTFADHPMIIRRRADCTKKIKYIMKRISKENVAQSGRQIAKLSHSNPGCLFQYILSQIQTWDNLIIPVVDSLKYLTNLSYDVLAYCIIEALGDPEKAKMTRDGTSISLWLQSLSVFCGAVYSKYSIELSGLLQYVANQLKAEESLDLIILKEIIYKMSGIETIDDITDDQLTAMTGGELLKYSGGSFNQIKNTKQSSQKLKNALLELDLVIPLCLLMAQQRHCILYKEREESHIKLVGKLYDQCQNTLVQYGSFLAKNFTAEDLLCHLPSLDSLLEEFKISADVAFYLYRPLFNHKIVSNFLEMQSKDRSYKSATGDEKIKKYLEVISGVMRSSVEAVRNHLPLQVWNHFSPQFYVTFWSLITYDINTPRGSYARERNKLDALITQTKNNQGLQKQKKKDLISHYQKLKKILEEEEKRQTDHTCRVAMRLYSEKDSWFLPKGAGKNEMISNFLQLCVFPRCVYSPIDAVYCAQFVRAIHDLKTPNFPTISCYDRIFCDITRWGRICTENEAGCYGRFLCVALATVHHWHSSKEIFEKECSQHPGFVIKIAEQSPRLGTRNLGYETFRNICYKWHCTITTASIASLESGDYLEIRNALIVLTKILPWFPYLLNLSPAIEKRVEMVINAEKNKRPDLYALATGYSGQLKSVKPSMIPQAQFHHRQNKSVVCATSANSIPSNTSPTTKGKSPVIARHNLPGHLGQLNGLKPALMPKQRFPDKRVNMKVAASASVKSKPDLKAKSKSLNMSVAAAEGKSLDIPGDDLSGYSGQHKSMKPASMPEPEIIIKEMKAIASATSKPDSEAKSNVSNMSQVEKGKSLDVPGDSLPVYSQQLKDFKLYMTPEHEPHEKQTEIIVAASPNCQLDLEEKSNSSNMSNAGEEKSLDVPSDNLSGFSEQLKKFRFSVIPEQEQRETPVS